MDGNDIDKDVKDSGEENEQYLAEDYAASALLLARTYKTMKSERENIRRWQSGERKFTEDDALAELISITPKADSSLGVAVQTSGTSDSTAKIGTLLASGYVQKRQAEVTRELFSPEMVEHIRYLDWKIDVVDTTGKERMTKDQRLIFSDIFIKDRAYSEIRGLFERKDRRMNKARISREKDKIVTAIANELKVAAQNPKNRLFIQMLMQEAREQSAKGNK